MALLAQPTQPNWVPAVAIRISLRSIPDAWRDYLYWTGELDTAILRRADRVGSASSVSGNICRSPTAEGVMREAGRRGRARGSHHDRQRGHRRVSLGELPIRERAWPPPRRGLELTHRARQFTRRGSRSLRSRDRDGPREPRETCAALIGRRTTPRAFACCAASIRPRRAGAEVPDPYYAGGEARLRGGPRSVRARVRRSARARARAAAMNLRSWKHELVDALGRDREPSSRSRAATSTTRVEVELADGRCVFVKTHATPPPGMYAAEAAGLAWLARGPLARAAGDRGRRRRSSRSSGSSSSRPQRTPTFDAGSSAAGSRSCTRSARRRSVTRDRASSRRSRRTTRAEDDVVALWIERRVAPAVRQRAANGCPTSTRSSTRSRERPDRFGPPRAAGAPARRSVVGQRRRVRRCAGADRSGGLRRSSRGRSRDARAVRRCERAAHRRVQRGVAARRPSGASRVPLWQLYPARRARGAVRRRLRRAGRAHACRATICIECCVAATASADFAIFSRVFAPLTLIAPTAVAVILFVAPLRLRLVNVIDGHRVGTHR